MSDTLVKVEGLSKKFCKNLKRSMLYGMQDIVQGILGRSPKTDRLRPSEFWALDNISFELKRGECLGVIGPNGSGKSTLLKILNGIITPDKGRIEIRGKVGALIEIGAGFHPMLTGRENIYINGSILGFNKKEIDNKFNAIVSFSEIEEFIDTPIKNYSSGMRVRLGFAIAAQMEPDILFIDEVLAVGDIGFRAKCYKMLSERLEKTTIILISHSMPDIARLCSRILVLAQGKYQYLTKNINVGIDLYYKAQKTPQGLIIKTSDAEFQQIIIKTKESDNLAKMSFDDELVINIIANVTIKIKKPIFHIAILNQSLNNIYHISSDNLFKQRENHYGIISIQVRVPPLYLRPGIYYLDFAITTNNKIQILARTHLCYKIQVTGNVFGYGAILTPSEWQLLN